MSENPNPKRWWSIFDDSHLSERERLHHLWAEVFLICVGFAAIVGLALGIVALVVFGMP